MAQTKIQNDVFHQLSKYEMCIPISNLYIAYWHTILWYYPSDSQTNYFYNVRTIAGLELISILIMVLKLQDKTKICRRCDKISASYRLITMLHSSLRIWSKLCFFPHFKHHVNCNKELFTNYGFKQFCQFYSTL